MDRYTQVSGPELALPEEVKDNVLSLSGRFQGLRPPTHTVSNLDSAPCSTTEPETWWFQTPFYTKEEIKVFKQQRWGHPPFLLLHSTESEIHGTMETRSKRESDAEKGVLVLFILSFNSLVPNAQPVPRTLDSSFFFSVRLKIGFRSFILKRGKRQTTSWWPLDSCFYFYKVAPFQ